MAIVLNLYLLLLSLLPSTLSPAFFLHTFNLAKADDILIERQCHETDVPATCIRCIKSDPQAKKAEKAADIAIIIINCLSNHAEILIANMSTLASSTLPEDKNFKNICEDCKKSYSQAKKHISAAALEVKKGDYDKANHLVVTALVNSRMVACIENIESQKSKVPDDIYFQMRIYEQLSGAATRIIDRLAHEQKP